MARFTPPIPQDPIKESFVWRDWFQRLSDKVFGTLAQQDANNVSITGGVISNIDIVGNNISNAHITDSYIDSTPIGLSIPSVSHFTSTVLDTPLLVAYGGTGVATSTANYVFAGPTTGAAAAPAFRALVAADIPSLSGSYVPYTGATTNVDLNNKSLVNINHLGVGTTVAPNILGRFVGDNGSLSRIAMRGYSSDANGSAIRVAKFRGTYTAPQVPQSGDSLGRFEFAGYATTSADGLAGAYWEAVTTEMWGAIAHGTKVNLYVTPNGAITPVVAITVDQDKKVTLAGHTVFEGVTSTGATGTNKLVYDTSPVLITPALGTPSSGTLTSCTGLPIGGIVATGTPSATTFLRGDSTWSVPVGAGDVVGPASAVASNVALFNGTTGKIIKDGGTLGTAAFTASTAYQAADTKLASIAALASAAGWLHNDGAGVFAYSTPTASNVGLGSVTNDAQTKASIVPNTVPSAGQLLAGNAGGSAYAAVSMSGDATIASTGAITVAKFGGTAFGTAAGHAATDFVITSAPVTKTADFTVATTENWLINNKSGSTCVVTMPAAASFTGRQVTIKNLQAQLVNSVASNIVPIDSASAGTSILLGVVGNWATMVSDGTNWIIMQQAPNNILLLE